MRQGKTGDSVRELSEDEDLDDVDLDATDGTGEPLFCDGKAVAAAAKFNSPEDPERDLEDGDGLDGCDWDRVDPFEPKDKNDSGVFYNLSASGRPQRNRADRRHGVDAEYLW